MVLPSGESAISFSQIRAEFGTNGDNTNGSVRLGQYRSDDASFTNKNIGELTNLPLDEGIPTSVSAGSSSINLDSFHGKKLNTVVDLYTSGNSTYNYNAKTERFDNGDYTIVGGYKSTLVESTESWNGGKKMIIHINNTFSSTGAVNQDDVALTVGNTWLADTTFSVDVGSSGIVAGKGGNGGSGGSGNTDSDSSAEGRPGGHGTSALAVETGTPVNIVAGGQINPGGGGGGGGGGANVGNEEGGGGGGGGGAGIPAGTGADGGGGGGAESGQSGDATVGGSYGEGGSTGGGEAKGQDGGIGGSVGRITSVTLNNGGSGYVVDEVITITGGTTDATFKVGTVDGSGTVTSITWHWSWYGGGYDPAVGTNIATTGGSGSNLTVDYATAEGMAGGVVTNRGRGLDGDPGAGGSAGSQIIYF